MVWGQFCGHTMCWEVAIAPNVSIWWNFENDTHLRPFSIMGKFPFFTIFNGVFNFWSGPQTLEMVQKCRGKVRQIPETYIYSAHFEWSSYDTYKFQIYILWKSRHRPTINPPKDWPTTREFLRAGQSLFRVASLSEIPVRGLWKFFIKSLSGIPVRGLWKFFKKSCLESR